VTDPTEARQYDEIVPATLAGERVDRAVSMMTDLSRREAVDLIRSGGVLIDGRVPSKPSERLSESASLLVELPARSHELEPDPDVDVPVVFEDEDVLVVDKPAGMVVHPGAGSLTGTMVQGLLHRYPDLAGVGGDPTRPGIVHRLDKGTSGLLLVARSEAAHRSLARQLRERTVLRRYRTLVWGTVASSEGVIDAPLARSLGDPTRRAVVAGGRAARTYYRVLGAEEHPGFTELSCRLETGRTHQIRVHLESIGHPVVGDRVYGRGRSPLGLARPFLHAIALGFTHPVTGEMHQFESPLPPDLDAFLTALRSSGPGG
jgi:23S rRNA pseudouridine1911/1915/1917 synthase